MKNPDKYMIRTFINKFLNETQTDVYLTVVGKNLDALKRIATIDNQGNVLINRNCPKYIIDKAVKQAVTEYTLQGK